MADFGNQQFYEVKGPEQTPEKKSRLDRRLILRWVFLIAVIVLLIVAIIVTRNFISNFRTDRQAEQSIFDNTASEIERKVQDCDEDKKDYCTSKYWTQAALDAKNVEYCKMVGDEWLASCVDQIALDVGDAELCSALKDQEKTDCADAVLLQNGVATSSFSLCEGIIESGVNNSCVNQVAKDLAEEGNCPASGFGADQCAAQIKLSKVINEGTCLKFQISSIEYESCIDALADRDSDGDGLSDLDEIQIYKTDHNDADSDNDGYNDGVEINSGFDPLN
ncbi:hypothetical protein CO057_02985 [Candidatus Uhrbacteria bacterium CG_4_9_14_0_2_um_filter_41_50]|uniref:Uncharacterized protein n=1 Tax=Candidatus Uhrbacteria bacterium CG_4_9_14_0_2_um_filter_41_50 TaxID=1975031 RepID=A0A2M8EP19_9BACT|nr:MAG: hypothetical protein COZ45_01365 [Candidatus Uhrbacteria bacterium CG_4_10_14_3_um_filter_41_21]PIZ54932.1 MAG: hypothetical protein COY24_02165 [Candidatus Uhrbacteria bacterium CG_4_10_14_0_2_um_filter_41_21]PJB84601.1 MAG: hypothetical protein CO086_02735 [Candidatus Uhrbacteria bacterium CG_4_9_14_0_8_um_filter_41_16]PJC24407.1 MAG: hypothetical protein CO057_02985 [Candidatus Uhrbacteria bacterium CG_4_9_14_0_2_um_filter_41_50]PJE75158.1 MAG: hypothetical protein COV03_01620 [Candi